MQLANRRSSLSRLHRSFSFAIGFPMTPQHLSNRKGICVIFHLHVTTSTCRGQEMVALSEECRMDAPVLEFFHELMLSFLVQPGVLENRATSRTCCAVVRRRRVTPSAFATWPQRARVFPALCGGFYPLTGCGLRGLRCAKSYGNRRRSPEFNQ